MDRPLGVSGGAFWHRSGFGVWSREGYVVLPAAGALWVLVALRGLVPLVECVTFHAFCKGRKFAW